MSLAILLPLVGPESRIRGIASRPLMAIEDGSPCGPGGVIGGNTDRRGLHAALGGNSGVISGFVISEFQFRDELEHIVDGRVMGADACPGERADLGADVIERGSIARNLTIGELHWCVPRQSDRRQNGGRNGVCQPGICTLSIGCAY